MPLFTAKIPGRARSKKNSKRILSTKGGRRFIASSKEFNAWAAYAVLFIVRAKQAQKLATIDYPCSLTVRAYYKNHAHSQDLDNVINSIADLLENAEVIKNDTLFYEYNKCRKIYGDENERLEIEIHPLEA